MLLWASKQLSYSRRETLGSDEEFAAVKMLPNEEHQNFDKVDEQRNLLEGEILH